MAFDTISVARMVEIDFQPCDRIMTVRTQPCVVITRRVLSVAVATVCVPGMVKFDHLPRGRHVACRTLFRVVICWYIIIVTICTLEVS